MNNEISMPVTKAVTAIGAAVVAKADVADKAARELTRGATYETWIFINSIPWGTIASIVAVIYTCLLITEWFWKKLWRPIFERKGWIKPRPRVTLFSIDEYKQMSETQRAEL